MAKMDPNRYDYREVACPHNGCAAKARAIANGPAVTVDQLFSHTRPAVE